MPTANYQYSKMTMVNEERPFQVYRAQTQGTPVHGHSHFLLMIVLEGTGCQVLNGHSFRLEPGTTVLMSPCDFHYNIPDEGMVEYYGLQFDSHFFAPRLNMYADYESYPLYGKLSETEAAEVRTLFGMLLEESSRPQAPMGSEAYCHSLIELLVLKAFRNLRQNQETDPSNTNIRKALVFIHEHFQEQITLAMVADAAGYSPAYFSQCFSHFLGTSFQNYLSSLRLRYAKNLLLSSDFSVSECAERAGFNSLSYFSNQFRQVYGCSPSDYIKERNLSK